jgi:2-oxoglutarate ferredoxin oxidoreductase subunit beta
MVELKKLSTGKYTPDWCPGCGDFGILMALKKAIVKLNLKPEEILVVSGIGCSSKLPQWLNTFGFHGLHGRGLPIALGAKIANKKLKIIVIGGDGDIYGEGIMHFIHAFRKNIDVTLLVHDNSVYGLTKGQTSPTTPHGRVTTSTPLGNYDTPLNPLALAISQGAPYVARGYSGNLKHLTNQISDAISFKGFSFVNIFQPCVTWNKINDYEWFNKRVFDLNEKKYRHNPKNQFKALERAYSEDKLPIGLFYKNERKLFEEEHIVLKKIPLVKQKIESISITNLLDELMS